MRRLQRAIDLAKGRCWDGYEPVEGKKAYSKGSCKPKKKMKKMCGPKMMKSLEAAQNAIQSIRRENDSIPSDGEVLDLSKSGYDAMFHHALHSMAADDACYGAMAVGEKSSPQDPKVVEKCRAISRKHEFMALRHALEEARKKGADYGGGQANKLRKYMDFLDSERYDLKKDPEFEKIKKYYREGGEFKAHKEDKFKEDY